MTVPSALAELMDGQTITSKLRRHDIDVTGARVDYVRYKPDETTIVGYVVTTGDGRRERGYVRWCTDTAEADVIEAKARTFRMATSRLGVATTRIDEHGIFYPFPNDARLRRMRWHTTPRKWKRTLGPLAPSSMQLSGTLSSGDILRYKPERRVVAAAHLATATGWRRSVLIRYATSNQAPWLAHIATSLRRSGIDTPRPLMQLDDGRVSVDEFIEADDLRVAVGIGRVRPDDVARTVAALHALPIAAPRRCVGGELEQTARGLQGLARWCRPAGHVAETVRRRLTSAAPSEADDVLLHGDLHDRNIMLRPGGAIAFVDLERVARGPAAIDLGQLRGSALAAGIRHPEVSVHAADFAGRTLDAYRGSRRQSPDDRAIAWHTAVALVGQALLAARHVETGWESSVGALLERALAEIA